LFWIKELGTAMPYGCNDNIKGVGNLSSPGCNEINVMSLFNTIPRTKRIGTVRCTKHRTVCMMVNLLDDSNFHRQTAVMTRLIEMIIQNPVFGIFCIRTKRSHGHKRIQNPNVKKSSKPRTLQATFNDLLSNIQKPLGIHHIRTILFSLTVNYLKYLRDVGFY
jgi:hypothetical protein